MPGKIHSNAREWVKGREKNDGALPRPLAGEGWGEGVSATGQSPRGESPHPRLRRDLSRKRER
ncbi:hypothetical protein C7U92_26015 [Bradyrhizobium sp. WBOS7]|uniref:Uncharacterized protein n=1 Tax=Bradyrhizobium betae TaxID=244734 RepID=A0AAE9NGN5_9BRAD|nr:hypothetical protein [Bradyrhizobium sp. WBOS2]MDD1574180.1 hypothetical protein [Bradyrhizobium sp. WBOS1]MDD1580153.1 hypothetical protein [Bradyrhizobium sp. WBOS7]MDD1603920.1 hypothetical protein [Bradyrhizobium sp. WBOS16]UUO38550.1 hypothetical protein DCK84_30830 [Bradyrhizobium sp. WBOS01]UUO44718.1 hypothetical protein DCM75_30805 [Bradyrhizobium sp. WBOS02]UUO55126.1 hypothetical protein DCM79_20400 [Bradyrhizobium sp. WBOS07]UUO69183.1 hypothetical protein DCM83_30850 [Bradyrh